MTRRNKVELFEMTASGLKRIDYPVTNMILLAEKR